jgi:glyoxylase-like metal-dependent hydrolase (beta-lactamase superfamily II)
VEKTRMFSSLTILISLPGGASVLVDPNDFGLSSPPGSEYYPTLKNYAPPPLIFDQLEDSGISLADVSHVVITHIHFDHYAGVTRKDATGRFRPSFPNAKYFLNRADWDRPETQESLANPTSEVSNSFGILNNQHLLEFVTGRKQLIPEIEILPAPGETPGHQVVRVHSAGETLYCTGDLFHDFVEVENPTAMASWADFETNLESKKSITEMALQENAYLVPAHMQLGRLSSKNSHVKWEAV